MKNKKNNSSRTTNSLKNMATGFLSRIVLLLTGLVTRTVFIWTLGNDYLSVGGLYGNILNVLSLAELGFGSAVVYNLYKPIVDQDYVKIKTMLAFYKKVYRVMGFVVLGVGLCLIPLLPMIIRNPPDIPNLTLYYIIFLANSSISYFAFAYKSALLNADQKSYVISIISNIVHVLRSIVQIAVLAFFRSYLLYLLIQLFATLLQNYITSRFVDKNYRVLNGISAERLSDDEVAQIKKDIRGLATIKVGHVILNSTDNIIISSFVGLMWVGLLDNYNLLIGMATGVICQISSAIQASLGNYFAEKSNEQGYQLFRNIEYVNSWMYAFCGICIAVLLEPFIRLWIGDEYILNESIALILAVNFFVQGYMNTLSIFRSTLGLFSQGWLKPIVVSVLNIVLSIALSYPWGVFGVLIATFISRLLVNLWYDPLIIFKYGFKKPIQDFYRIYTNRIIQYAFIYIIVRHSINIIRHLGDGILVFILMVFVTGIEILLIFWIFNHRTEGYRYAKSTAVGILSKLRIRRS